MVFNVKFSTYCFDIKAKIVADFQICVSLPLIIFITCSVKDLENFFKQYLLLYTSCLFFVALNGNIVGIEITEGICSLNFAVDEFSG